MTIECWTAECSNPAANSVGMCELHHARLLQTVYGMARESMPRDQRCAGCGQLFRVGDTIRVDLDEDDPQYFHDRCEPTP